jgi:hypothetical protein
LARGRIQVALETAGYVASFDDVVIEGAIVEDPDEISGPAGKPIGPRVQSSVFSNPAGATLDAAGPSGPPRSE